MIKNQKTDIKCCNKVKYDRKIVEKKRAIAETLENITSSTLRNSNL